MPLNISAVGSVKGVINLDCGTAVAVSDMLGSKKRPFWADLQSTVFIYPLLKDVQENKKNRKCRSQKTRFLMVEN